MSKKSLYETELNNHIIYGGWDYLTPEEVRATRKANRDGLHLDGFDNRASLHKTHVGYVLQSYSTIVAYISCDGDFKKLWQGFSVTTLKHVNAARRFCGLSALSKKEWILMPTSENY